jgi:hypothetical protein
MFCFQFSDVLLYCARSSSSVLQFKIHGEYPLKNLQVHFIISNNLFYIFKFTIRLKMVTHISTYQIHLQFTAPIGQYWSQQCKYFNISLK